MGEGNESGMSFEVNEIYWAKVPYGSSEDPRPCIVLSHNSDQTVTVVRLSSAVELYNPAIHFWLDSARAEFRATGLSKTCYCDGSKILTINADRLTAKLGQLEGKLADEFNAWI
jgi:hypothetical protein